MNRTIVGLILLDAPHSALNNAGQEAGSRTENAVGVKKIKVAGKEYPYVSGQAFRYWWRTALVNLKEWVPSPMTRDAKIAYTAANPITYEEDDVFGYMAARKEGTQNVTLTRVSPLKCSPLISLLAGTTLDFGVMSRHEGNPVPYEYQLYATTLKGIFSLHLEEVGKFYEKERAGYKNLNSELKKEAIRRGAIEKDGTVYLNSVERKKRITDTIEVLPYLYGGAKQAVAHTDTSPKLIVMAVLTNPNPIFMNVIHEKEGKVIFNTEGFEQVIKDYAEKIISPIFIGYRKGFLPTMESDLTSLGTTLSGKEIKVLSPNEAVTEMSKWIKEELKYLE